MNAYEVEVYSNLQMVSGDCFIVEANSIAHAIDIALREIKNKYPDWEVAEIHAKLIKRDLLK